MSTILSIALKKTDTPSSLPSSPYRAWTHRFPCWRMSREVGYRSPDASMSWIFEDGGLDTKVTGGTFTISKTLRTKIESILVKMITYWQQYFFRDVLEKNALRSGLMPVIDEDEAGDTDEEPEDEEDMQGEDGPRLTWTTPDIPAGHYHCSGRE